MGLYNRRLGVRHSTDQPAGDPGNVAFIGQSGTHTINFSLVGSVHGIKCSKTVSFGNAVILDAPDYIDYFAQDPESEVIAIYIEGVKDGPRFLSSLKAAAQKKPVVVWKGGTTAAGGRAVYSHTASLASDGAIWDAAMRQAGVIQTDNLDETIDVVKALVHIKPFATTHSDPLTLRAQSAAADAALVGRAEHERPAPARMGLVAMTGGQSVVITDAFEREGLEVPLLTDASYEKLSQFFNIIGGSYRNPLDAGGTIGMGFVPGNLQKLFEILDEDANIDAVALEISGTFMARRMRQNPAIMDALVDMLANHKEASPKPFMAIAHPSHVEDVMAEIRHKLLDRGVATFTTFQSAARAIEGSSVLALVSASTQLPVPR